MYRIHCMNNISTVGTAALERAGYDFVDDPGAADAWLVRSANLHEIGAPDGLLAVAGLRGHLHGAVRRQSLHDQAAELLAGVCHQNPRFAIQC